MGAPEDGADTNQMLGIVEQQYGISYEELVRISQDFTTEWRLSRNVYGIYECFRVYFAEQGIQPIKETPVETDERAVNDDDIKLALFGGDGEVTDEMWDEALFAVQLIKERHKREKEKNGRPLSDR